MYYDKNRVCSLCFPVKYHMARGLIELGVFLILFWTFCFPLSEEPFCWNTPRSAKVFKFYGRWVSQEDQHQWRIYIVKFWTRLPPPSGIQILSISCNFWGNLAKSYVCAPRGLALGVFRHLSKWISNAPVKIHRCDLIGYYRRWILSQSNENFFPGQSLFS